MHHALARATEEFARLSNELVVEVAAYTRARPDRLDGLSSMMAAVDRLTDGYAQALNALGGPSSPSKGPAHGEAWHRRVTGADRPAPRPLPALERARRSAVTEPSLAHGVLLLSVLDRYEVPYERRPEDDRYVVVYDALVRTDTLCVSEAMRLGEGEYRFRGVAHPIVLEVTNIEIGIEHWVLWVALLRAGVEDGTAAYAQVSGRTVDDDMIDQLREKWNEVQLRDR